jgi:hypothetical protein
MRSGFPLPQIATGDLDVGVVGLLAATDLSLGDEFEPGSVKVIGFEASFRSRGLGQQNLEHAPGNPHHTLIFAHADAKLDGVSVRVPPGIGWEAEEHVSAQHFVARLTFDGCLTVTPVDYG